MNTGRVRSSPIRLQDYVLTPTSTRPRRVTATMGDSVYVSGHGWQPRWTLRKVSQRERNP